MRTAEALQLGLLSWRGEGSFIKSNLQPGPDQRLRADPHSASVYTTYGEIPAKLKALTRS